MRIFNDFHLVRPAAFVAAAVLAAAAAHASSGSSGLSAKPDAARQNAAKERLYCIEDTITGSRLRRQDCRTAAQWKAEGIDVTAAR